MGRASRRKRERRAAEGSILLRDAEATLAGCERCRDLDEPHVIKVATHAAHLAKDAPNSRRIVRLGAERRHLSDRLSAIKAKFDAATEGERVCR